MLTRLIFGAILALALSLAACDAPIPDELTAPPPKIEVATIPMEYTEPIEPTLAVEITPDKLYVSTYFLHDTWREHLEKTFEKARSEEHWFAARQKLDGIYEELDKGVLTSYGDRVDTSTWRMGRIEVADLQDGNVSASHIRGQSGLFISPLYDELIEQIDILDHVAEKTGAVNQWVRQLPQHCLSYFCGPYRSKLLLVVHPDVPAQTVQQVIYTASSFNELDQFELVVNADQPRMVPIAVDPNYVGPPLEDEVTESCAMAHVSRASSLYLIFDQVKRDYDASLVDWFGATEERFEVLRRYPGEAAVDADETWKSRPAWDDALLVASDGNCHSGAYKSIAQASQRLEHLIDAFEAAAVCKNAFVDFPLRREADNKQEKPLTATDAIEVIAALRAVDSVDNVFVTQQHDEQPATDEALGCARTYRVDVP